MKRSVNCFVFLLLLLFSSCSSTWDDYSKGYTSIDVFDDFWRSYDLYYANFLVKSIDWDHVYVKYRSRINEHTTPEELYHILNEIELKELRDGHSYIAQTKEALSSYQPLRTGFDDTYMVSERYYKYEVDLVTDKMDFVEYGYIKSSKAKPSLPIGYIKVNAFMPNKEPQSFNQFKDEVDNAMDFLKTSHSIILDVRNNRGGFSAWSEYLAGYFYSETREYLIERVRYNDNRTDLRKVKSSFVVKPSSSFTFKGDCVVLTNKSTASAAEIFVVVMKGLPNVITLGSRTFGIFSPSMYRELINGWFVRIPVSDVRLPTGKSYEGVGLTPDIEMKNINLSNFEDPTLIKAIEYARVY
ncbi:S41 family peptidase [Prolixibacteraceae bacterium]|nr:S41 family peptidase [Prolixibacteraceae bacterium]